MKRSRPRRRSSYRDSVLTIPCDPERFKLEEEKIKSAYKKLYALFEEICNESENKKVN